MSTFTRRIIESSNHIRQLMIEWQEKERSEDDKYIEELKRTAKRDDHKQENS